MTTKRNPGKRPAKKRTPCRGWSNPSQESRRMLEPVAEWEADVVATSHGPNRPELKRKVVTRGTKKYNLGEQMDDILDYLRKGYEVRLYSDTFGDAIRLYPCLDANYKTMFVAAMTMGDFRHAISDITFRIKRCGEEINPDKESANKDRKAELIREERRSHVTPDMVVTCPNCGTEFRVGKQLV